MSVLRQGNYLGQQRIDVPHLRAIDSSIAADFDLLAGQIMAGKAPLIVSGFYLATAGVTQAEALQLQVADSVLVHFQASESGSIFRVPTNRANEVLTNTNPRIVGSWTPGQVNYIGIDLVRSADASTSDLVMFLDTSTLVERAKTVPLARTLDYRIVISTADFTSTPGIAPIAKVTTTNANGVSSVEDARNLFWRLGSGGTAPNSRNVYSWPGGRTEGGSDAFVGGDKAITSLKGCLDAVMTRIWELGGGEYWYSPTADRNVRMAYSGTTFANGEFFEWDGTHLHWQGVRFVFDNSTGYVNEVANQTTNSSGLTNLADGECLYVDLDRTQNRTSALANQLTAAKASLALLGAGSPPGGRYVIAWRYGSDIFVRDQPYPVGSSFKHATTTTAGAVRVSQIDADADLAGEAMYAATVNSTAPMAYRVIGGGLSRGNSGFVGGAGDLNIGGGTDDQDVTIRTAAAQYATTVSGITDFVTSGGLAVLNVDSNVNYTGNKRQRVIAAKGYNGSAYPTAFTVEAIGALGHRLVADTPETPAPTTADPIRAKTFFRTNGQASPNTRDQYCVMWWDGSVLVIAESAPY